MRGSTQQMLCNCCWSSLLSWEKCWKGASMVALEACVHWLCCCIFVKQATPRSQTAAPPPPPCTASGTPHIQMCAFLNATLSLCARQQLEREITQVESDKDSLLVRPEFPTCVRCKYLYFKCLLTQALSYCSSSVYGIQIHARDLCFLAVRGAWRRQAW